MEVIYTPDALADLDFWKRTGNSSVQAKISSLINSICETPFEGVGKPEPLKHMPDMWSRRINREHRIMYSVNNGEIEIYSLKGHYKKR